MANVLVTGGTGLVGNGVRLAAASYEDADGLNFIFLSSKDVDLKQLNELERVFDKYRPSYVLHLAAQVGGLYRNMREKVEFFENNMIMDINVLRCCRKFSVKKVVSCLSTCIFPDQVEYPIDEKKLHLGPPHDSNATYAYAKRMLHVLSLAYREQYNLNCTTVIPTNVYGPFDNFNLRDGHVAPSLIHQCYLAKKDSKRFEVKGSGKPLRQFIYSIDLGKLLIWTLKHYDDPEPVILSVPEDKEISIAQLANHIATAFDFEGKIEFNTQWADGQYKKSASAEKLLGLIRDFEFTPIDIGIQSTIKWFIENFDVCRK
eukprot:g4377.t1